ncbi:MAG: hypothetical protein ACI30A_03230 [Paludibacteraceae bacterium]
MNLDLASFAFGANLIEGTGTSPWGTALGQGQPEYKFTTKGYDTLLVGMVYNSVPLRLVGMPLGRGGNTVYCHENDGCQLAAVFHKVYVNNVRINAPFSMVIYRESSASHSGRRHLKYSPRIFFTDVSGYIHSNQEFIDKIYETLGLSPAACWFVHNIEIEHQDELHLQAIIVNPHESVLYENSKERAEVWRSLVSRE